MIPETKFLSFDFNDPIQLRLAVEGSRIFSVHELKQLYRIAVKDFKALVRGKGNFHFGDEIISGEDLTSERKARLLVIVDLAKDKLAYLIRIRSKLKSMDMILNYLQGKSYPAEHVYVQFPLDYKWNVEQELCLN